MSSKTQSYKSPWTRDGPNSFRSRRLVRPATQTGARNERAGGAGPRHGPGHAWHGAGHDGGGGPWGIHIMGGGPGVRMGWNAPPTQWSPKTKQWQRRWRDRTSCPTKFFAPPDDVRKKLSKLGFAKSAPCHVGSVSCWIRVMPTRRNETNPTAHGKRSLGLVSIVFGFGGKV